MRGTIRQRKSGRWAYGLTLPGRDPATGKRRQITKSGFRTRKECQAALIKVLDQINERTYARPTRLTVAKYIEDWLGGCDVRPTTLARYRSIVAVHLVPGLGHLKLVDLTPADLKRLYAALRDRGLSVKTVRHVHSVIHKALSDACDLDLLSRNVADRVRPPKARTAKELGADLACWSPAQLRAFLAHVRGDRLYAAWRLAAQSGMRRGELVGLRWQDVDLDAGTVRVAATRVMVSYTVQVSDPKTEKGRRTFAVDPDTAAALKAWRLTQTQERLRVGPGWQDSGYLFTNADGSPIHPQRFSDWFHQRTKAAGLPRIRLHDVRHSYATAGLAAGVPLKVMSARLGHANTAITADLYQHVLPAMDEAAALQVAAVIDG
jgi:integrase